MLFWLNWAKSQSPYNLYRTYYLPPFFTTSVNPRWKQYNYKAKLLLDMVVLELGVDGGPKYKRPVLWKMLFLSIWSTSQKVFDVLIMEYVFPFLGLSLKQHSVLWKKISLVVCCTIGCKQLPRVKWKCIFDLIEAYMPDTSMQTWL